MPQLIVYSMSFRDPVAGATLRCTDGMQFPTNGATPSYPGCELRRDGSDAVIFSFISWDMGVERMIGATRSLVAEPPLRVTNVLAIRAD